MDWGPNAVRRHLRLRLTKPIVKTFETVEQASKALMDASPEEKISGEKVSSPIEVLGALVAKWKGKQYLGVLFVEVVSFSRDESVKGVKGEMRRPVESARKLGSSIEELGCTLERV